MEEDSSYEISDYEAQHLKPEPKRNVWPYIIATILLLILGAAFMFLRLDEPAPNFPVDTRLEISSGMNTTEITEKLREGGYIRSPFYMYIALRTQFSNSYIQAGEYVFPKRLSNTELLHAITQGEYLVPPRKVTFPEGLRGETLAPIIDEALPHLAPVRAELLDQKIGYLFPETYFVSEDVTLLELITLMENTYATKTQSVAFDASPNELTEAEVVILASIIEREANDEKSMRIVSGILHNRLAIDMALQVDATFEFLLGKTSAELTENDLSLNSPYNTYTNRGLPPTPIANPGLQAIEAAVDPEPNEYLYYLTGNDGNFYYAETFAEHKRNKERYLR